MDYDENVQAMIAHIGVTPLPSQTVTVKDEAGIVRFKREAAGRKAYGIFAGHYLSKFGEAILPYDSLSPSAQYVWNATAVDLIGLDGETQSASPDDAPAHAQDV